ncbi:L,D-transpeptidase family protein [Cognatiluteimonas profundi]|uniref:L,D-transpeptidase family protein n=1 Tax=Cognatiluteimonas profundi TaxID=2594501 RepID=UPI00131B0114|nr:L,D-transpeptidase [Lysobacter profundi]
MHPGNPSTRKLAVAVSSLLLTAAFATSARPQETTLPAPAPATSVDAINAAQAGDSHDAILRAQILLDRAHFSPGEIDGRGGSNTRRAISGFQASRDLPVTGTLDDATWSALIQDAQPALVSYALTDADAAGPFEPIPADMMEKAKLPALGYSSVQEAMGEKFHASPALLEKLNPGTSFAVGEQIIVPNVMGVAGDLPKAAKVVVDKSDATVSLVDAAGKTYAQFPATMGSSHDPLPLGDWKIQGVGNNPTFQYNPALFWDANPRHSKAMIPAGPNNPVGVVWVDLSKEHYGIHGTPEPAKIGKTESHGCIRLTNWDALTLSHSVGPGTPAVLQE